MRADGFTLVELLIVMVVLSVLAGIAVFGVLHIQDDADEACSNANTRIDRTVDAAPGTGAYADGGTC